MMPRATIVALLGTVGILAAAALAPWLKFVLTVALAKGLAVMGILLLLRAGQVSFGHALYLSIGAYTVAFLRPAVPDLLVLLPLAAAVALGVGLVIGLFVARYRDIFFGMLNLAFSMVFHSLLEKLYAITKGTDGIRVFRPTVAGFALERLPYEWAVLGLALLLALGLGWLAARFLVSPLGQALVAIKTRETRLEFAGVSARRVLLVAYAASAALGGLAGALLACTTLHVTPHLAYWTQSGELVFIAILGGGGSILGPYLGSVVYELVRVYAAAALPDAWQMVLGAVLLGIILFASRGLWGLYEDLVMRGWRRA
ncbi:branched-chain amino acid ABC transporter permease [Elioraea thermophila]|uniref:branched-chain amino acid ABC transporter permease n=1 Tax=Elioraea thermophila TaxID=2185104 RepID=UPI000DF36DEF|nr:branched-chain amino acid ABC transporter permease [Elioraea thermophila]